MLVMNFNLIGTVIYSGSSKNNYVNSMYEWQPITNPRLIFLM